MIIPLFLSFNLTTQTIVADPKDCPQNTEVILTSDNGQIVCVSESASLHGECKIPPLEPGSSDASTGCSDTVASSFDPDPSDPPKRTGGSGTR